MTCPTKVTQKQYIESLKNVQSVSNRQPLFPVEVFEVRKISIRLTEQQYEFLEMLVNIGEYASISEAIRDAIRKLISEKSEVLERASKLKSYM